MVFYVLITFFADRLVFTADDKGGMGGSTEKGTRRKRAEAEGETRQRGETGPGRIENKKKYPLLLKHEFS